MCPRPGDGNLLGCAGHRMWPVLAARDLSAVKCRKQEVDAHDLRSGTEAEAQQTIK
jgi:hypothetical protein